MARNRDENEVGKRGIFQIYIISKFMRMPCFFFIFSLLLFLLCSCGDTIVEMAERGDAQRSGSISVVATDAATGLPAANAEVLLLGRDNEPKKINSGVLYENLPIGKGYVFHIGASGYASVKCKADVLSDSIASGSVIEARLPKLGAKLQGSIAYMDLSTNAVNAYATGRGEAKIRLKLNIAGECELLNPYRETATGLNGTYFFDSLPEFASYDLFALETRIDGIEYEQFLVQSGGTLGFSGDIAKAPIGIYRNAFSQEEFRLVSVPDTVAPNKKISLVFSKNINKSRVNSGVFSITGIDYAVEVKWNGDRTLEVSPVDGLWEVDNIVSIANTAELYATDGTAIPPGILANVLVTDGVLGAVPKFWIENSGTGTALNAKGDSLDLEAFQSQWQGLSLRWNSAVNATSYTVYYKCADKVNYTPITVGLTPASDTSAILGYTQVYYCFAQNKISSFFVQARNTRQQSNSEIVSILGYIKPPIIPEEEEES